MDKNWSTNPRWKGVERPYSFADVKRLQGSVLVEHTLARRGAEKLWQLLQSEPFVPALGALTGNQASACRQDGTVCATGEVFWMQGEAPSLAIYPEKPLPVDRPPASP